MSGATVGFLFHNRYKASILLGNVGSLGLGGALSVMAACTGMFLPLFISSGVFILEAVSVVLQVWFCILMFFYVIINCCIGKQLHYEKIDLHLVVAKKGSKDDLKDSVEVGPSKDLVVHE